jgi:uncharacterized paraquat-inducible protein A
MMETEMMDWEMDEIEQDESPWTCACCGAMVPAEQMPYCPECEADLDRRDPLSPFPVEFACAFDGVPF